MSLSVSTDISKTVVKIFNIAPYTLLLYILIENQGIKPRSSFKFLIFQCTLKCATTSVTMIISKKGSTLINIGPCPLTLHIETHNQGIKLLGRLKFFTFNCDLKHYTPSVTNKLSNIVVYITTSH
jgi:hypothetical protein